jgi:hypothetical protein
MQEEHSGFALLLSRSLTTHEKSQGKANTMWKRSFSTDVRGTAEQVWDIWRDVANWRSWETGIASSQLHGPFEEGVEGELKPKSGPMVQWLLSEVKPLEAFTSKARLPLGMLEFSHQITPITDARIRVTHSVQISGVSTFLFKYLVGRSAAADIPNALANLKARVEEG